MEDSEPSSWISVNSGESDAELEGTKSVIWREFDIVAVVRNLKMYSI